MIVKMSGVIAKFGKEKIADQCPIGLGLIKEIYVDAIEYTGIPKGTRGMLTVFGLLNLSMMTLIAKELIFFRAGGIRFGLLDMISMLLAAVALFFGVYLAARFARLEYSRPINEPVNFDRKYRKVYRIFRETYPGVRGLLKPWAIRQTVHDWDLVEAEHHASVDANTATISRILLSCSPFVLARTTRPSSMG